MGSWKNMHILYVQQLTFYLLKSKFQIVDNFSVKRKCRYDPFNVACHGLTHWWACWAWYQELSDKWGHARLALAVPAGGRQQSTHAKWHGDAACCKAAYPAGAGDLTLAGAEQPQRCWALFFPAQVQLWEMPCTTEGSAGSGAHQWYCTCGDEVCTPLPASATEQKATLTFPCPFRGGSGVPKTRGGT